MSSYNPALRQRWYRKIIIKPVSPNSFSDNFRLRRGYDRSRRVGSLVNCRKESDRRLSKAIMEKMGLGIPLLGRTWTVVISSLGNYCADDVPGDIEFAHFFPERDNKHIIPFKRNQKNL